MADEGSNGRIAEANRWRPDRIFWFKHHLVHTYNQHCRARDARLKDGFSDSSLSLSGSRSQRRISFW
ncbi:hypothetical protein M404DRAFT_1009066 [Pisolithus tinctorius Marx 270]|uniref:Uncharacterized protein n=1 Tax=Pisolithus tinctorius Marx 270 TaxID=870435 RepID=A0A0C3NCI3_PISTI|nr:hypothetical protein M404DRAFT_1009066 [Pisolithus tinctorius Marx 270]